MFQWPLSETLHCSFTCKLHTKKVFFYFIFYIYCKLFVWMLAWNWNSWKYAINKEIQNSPVFVRPFMCDGMHEPVVSVDFLIALHHLLAVSLWQHWEVYSKLASFYYDLVNSTVTYSWIANNSITEISARGGETYFECVALNQNKHWAPAAHSTYGVH